MGQQPRAAVEVGTLGGRKRRLICNLGVMRRIESKIGTGKITWAGVDVTKFNISELGWTFYCMLAEDDPELQLETVESWDIDFATVVLQLLDAFSLFFTGAKLSKPKSDSEEPSAAEEPGSGKAEAA
jgi:hypothetical protein